MRNLRVPAGDEGIVHGDAGKRESRVCSESVTRRRSGRAVAFADEPNAAVGVAGVRRELERPCAVMGISCIDSGKVIGLTTR
jgi:hypothetical protein